MYALLRKAMEESGLAAVARYVMRNREHLGCLRVRERVITLEKMYFADEIRPIDEIAPRNVTVGKEELGNGRRPDRPVHDDVEAGTSTTTRTGSGCSTVIRAKGKGKEVSVEEAAEPEAPEDLVEALRASVEAAKKRRRPDERVLAPEADASRGEPPQAVDGARRARRDAAWFPSGPMSSGDEIDALYALPLDEFTRRAERARAEPPEGGPTRRGGGGLRPAEADPRGLGRQPARARAALGGRVAPRTAQRRSRPAAADGDARFRAGVDALLRSARQILTDAGRKPTDSVAPGGRDDAPRLRGGEAGRAGGGAAERGLETTGFDVLAGARCARRGRRRPGRSRESRRWIGPRSTRRARRLARRATRCVRRAARRWPRSARHSARRTRSPTPRSAWPRRRRASRSFARRGRRRGRRRRRCALARPG